MYFTKNQKYQNSPRSNVKGSGFTLCGLWMSVSIMAIFLVVEQHNAASLLKSLWSRWFKHFCQILQVHARKHYCYVSVLIQDDTYPVYSCHDYAHATNNNKKEKFGVIFFFLPKAHCMDSSLCVKEWGKNNNISKTDIWEFSMSHRKMKNAGRKKALGSFLILTPSPLSPLPLPLSGLGSTWIQSSVDCSGIAACV